MDYRASKRQKIKHANGNWDIDLISSLPDDLVINIIARLDTLSAFRVSLMSRRLHHIWQCTPLCLDDSHFGDREVQLRVQILKHLIHSHPGPVRRVSLSFINLVPQISNFVLSFRSKMFDELAELILDFPVKYVMTDRQALPVYMLRFRSIRVLHIARCIVRTGTMFSSSCLVDLQLCWVRIPEETLHFILSRCLKIERVALLWCSGYRSLSMSNLHELHNIIIRLTADDNHDEMELQTLVIENARNLELLYINQHAYGPSVTISGETQLKMLGYFGLETPRLQIGNSIFMQSIASKLVDYFPNVKILALKMLERDEHGVGHVADFLYCFPCLEVLHVTFVDDLFQYCYPEMSGGDGSKYDPYGSICCLKHTLKSVSLWNYSFPNMSDLYQTHVPQDIANYFAANGRALQKLMLGADRKLSIETVEHQFKSLKQRSTTPVMIVLALLHKRDLRQLRHGDPFSLLGSVYHEINLLPQISNAEDHSEDGNVDDDRDDAADGGNYSMDGDVARIQRDTQSGGPAQMDYTGSDFENDSSEACQERERHENTECLRKDLLSNFEDEENMIVLMVPTEDDSLMKNEFTTLPASQDKFCKDQTSEMKDFKGKENTTLSEVEISKVEIAKLSIISDSTRTIIRFFLEAVSKALNEREGLLQKESRFEVVHGRGGSTQSEIERIQADYLELLKSKDHLSFDILQASPLVTVASA